MTFSSFRAVVHGADVADLPLLVEDEEVRGIGRAVRPAHGLRLIVTVDVVGLVFLRVVLDAGDLVLVHGRDGDADHLDVLVLEFLGELDDAVFVNLDDRAMVRQEDQDHDVFLEVRQADAGVLAVLDGGEAREGRGLVAHVHDLVVMVAGQGGDRDRGSYDRDQAQKDLSHRCILLLGCQSDVKVTTRSSHSINQSALHGQVNLSQEFRCVASGWDPVLSGSKRRSAVSGAAILPADGGGHHCETPSVSTEARRTQDRL